MPSRRTILASLGGVTLSGVGAWLWLTPATATGYVQEKSIEVRYRADNRTHSESVVTVSLGSPPGSDTPQLDWLHDDWEAEFDSPTTPVVSDVLHQQLQRAYEDVRYVVGVCSPSWSGEDREIGCYNAPTSRADFNRVQVHDRVTAARTDAELSIRAVDGTWTFDDR
jgi:hypothetical protein